MKIGILVSSNDDITAQEIYKWILYFGHEPVLINEKVLVNNQSLLIHFNSKDVNIEIQSINGELIDFNKIDYFYQRKWTTQFLTNKYNNKELIEIVTSNQFQKYWKIHFGHRY